MSLTIYGVYRSRASRNIWLALEAGIPFRHVPVIQHDRMPHPAYPPDILTTASPAFRAMNPAGQIPCAEIDGLMLSESLAINLHLARKTGGPLGPETEDENALMTQWSLWAATSVEPHSIQILYNRLGGGASKVKDEAKALAAIEALKAPFALLDGVLAKTGHVVGGRFTVADINVAEICRYARPAPELFRQAPHVDRWIAACHERPAYRQMWAAREAEPA